MDADTRGLAERIQDAYEAWCRPRMSSMVEDHPAHAFEAGYRAALEAAGERERALREALQEMVDVCAGVDTEGVPEAVAKGRRALSDHGGENGD